jgi:RNA exonuclease 1
MEIVPDIIEKSLDEVYKDLERLFDDNSILAGHSIENDLKYLKIYYPYIIDTSIIFNVSGNRLEKASLQKLYAIFFGFVFIESKKRRKILFFRRLIQKIRNEHDPTEDARATMELIQLKLSKSMENLFC